MQKELPQPGFILADIGIDLAVSALEIRVPDHGRAAVPGAGDVNHVEVVLLDNSVQVRVNEVLSEGRTSVSQQGPFQQLRRPLPARSIEKPE